VGEGAGYPPSATPNNRGSSGRRQPQGSCGLFALKRSQSPSKHPAQFRHGEAGSMLLDQPCDADDTATVRISPSSEETAPATPASCASPAGIEEIALGMSRKSPENPASKATSEPETGAAGNHPARLTVSLLVSYNTPADGEGGRYCRLDAGEP
jgi:hypothetical protein